MQLNIAPIFLTLGACVVLRRQLLAPRFIIVFCRYPGSPPAGFFSRFFKTAVPFWGQTTRK